MATRRKFLQNSALTLFSLPLLTSTTGCASGPVTTEFPLDSDPDYWGKIRDLFPMPRDETYFNYWSSTSNGCGCCNSSHAALCHQHRKD